MIRQLKCFTLKNKKQKKTVKNKMRAKKAVRHIENKIK